MTTKDNLYEDEIKDAILNNNTLLSYLGDIGQTTVIYEKTLPIYGNKVIADALMFTEHAGVVSFEIKTQHDSLARLPHQLDAYIKASTYNFVFCHDSQLAKVEEILKARKYQHVGIISYEEFDGEVLPGLIRPGLPSPYFNLRVLANCVLWKKELYNILKTYIDKPNAVARNTYGTTLNNQTRSANKQTGDMYRISHLTGTINKQMSKKRLLTTYTKTFDDYAGTKVICELYIMDGYDPEKNLVIYHKGHYRSGDVAFKYPYDYHKYRGR